jgi:hypothetical protein
VADGAGLAGNAPAAHLHGEVVRASTR